MIIRVVWKCLCLLEVNGKTIRYGKMIFKASWAYSLAQSQKTGLIASLV